MTVTSSSERETGMSFGRFVAFAVATLAILWAIGYLPTVNLAGPRGIPAMFVGGAVALVASLVGTVPILLVRGREPQAKVTAAMGATAARVGVAIVLALALALSRLWAVGPLLLWIAIAHAGLLIVDTLYARSHMRTGKSGAESKAGKGSKI